jgi:hypothetical protein
MIVTRIELEYKAIYIILIIDILSNLKLKFESLRVTYVM